MYDNLNRGEHNKWKLGNNTSVDLLIMNPRYIPSLLELHISDENQKAFVWEVTL
jgi:hypothetical protein